MLKWDVWDRNWNPAHQFLRLSFTFGSLGCWTTNPFFEVEFQAFGSVGPNLFLDPLHWCTDAHADIAQVGVLYLLQNTSAHGIDSRWSNLAVFYVAD